MIKIRAYKCSVGESFLKTKDGNYCDMSEAYQYSNWICCEKDYCGHAPECRREKLGIVVEQPSAKRRKRCV